MKEIFEIAGAILLSLGGSGAIVFSLSSWLGKIWAQRIINKEELLNNYLLHSSQIQFDREYKIYSQIWLKLLNLKWDTLAMMPKFDYLPKEKEERKIEYMRRYEKFVDSLNDYHKEIYTNAPFISEDIYNDLVEIGKLSREQGIEFSTYKLEIDEDERTYKETKEYYERNNILSDKVDNLTNKLREYLKKYKVG